MNEEIQISSVMLCFNRLALSKKCLESYLKTITVPHELVIVDNASTDSTRDWLEDVKKDTRIREVLHMEKNNPASALNSALALCTGRYLHVMENDYIYRKGLGEYVLNCFDKIPDLGQLCVCPGPPRLIGTHHMDLVHLSLGNVVSSSVFRRDIFFVRRIKWQNIYKGCMPDDEGFSEAVKKAGFLVAWPDKEIAEAVGFSYEEFRRDPDYYIRNYKQKLHNSLSSLSIMNEMMRFRIDPGMKEALERLLMLYWIKVKKHYFS